MADETPDDRTPESPSPQPAPSPQPTRRPTAAASAASRARRIGGARSASPVPNPPAAPDSSDAGAPTPVPDARDSPPVSVEKPHDAGATVDGDDEVAPPDTAAPDRAVVEVPAWLRWVPAGVLSACAITMIVLVLVVAHGVWYAKPSAAAMRDRVLAAAKTCTAAANTYSYQTLKQDEAKGLACSTGAWSHQYRAAIKNIVTPAATRLKASQSIQINNAGIETISSNGRQWTVVIFGQTKITQSGEKPRFDPFSAQVVMTDTSGKWLISKIKTIVNPSG